MGVGDAQIPERQSPVVEDSNTSPPPRPTSVKQIEANRRNALRSTGPRTPGGKQASRLNAMTHGLRANEVIIPGQEDPEHLDAIFRELCEDWEPEGHTEIHLVEQIGLAEWRPRRAHRAGLGAIPKHTARPAERTFELDSEQAANPFPHTLSKTFTKNATRHAYPH